MFCHTVPVFSSPAPSPARSGRNSDGRETHCGARFRGTKQHGSIDLERPRSAARTSRISEDGNPVHFPRLRTRLPSTTRNSCSYQRNSGACTFYTGLRAGFAKKAADQQRCRQTRPRAEPSGRSLRALSLHALAAFTAPSLESASMSRSRSCEKSRHVQPNRRRIPQAKPRQRLHFGWSWRIWPSDFFRSNH